MGRIAALLYMPPRHIRPGAMLQRAAPPRVIMHDFADIRRAIFI